jgi:hypothetical protein
MTMTMADSTGYCHRDYAYSLAEFGRPRELPGCGGWILERPIPGYPHRDAMGCYPLFACRDWPRLGADLEGLTGDLVCVSLVTDPFGEYTAEQLHECFPDRMVAFKRHYVLDLRCRPGAVVRKRARTYAKAALRHLGVEICDSPQSLLDDWIAAYQHLIEKYQLAGIHVFSPRAFMMQMNVPGFVMSRAVHQGATVGMLSWYVQGDVGYAHLVAVSPAGYRLRAAYALYWSSIQYFAGKLRWLDLGGVPGTRDNQQAGLAMFKRGWSSDTRQTYFCGRIFDRRTYDEIARTTGVSCDAYFPCYRAGQSDR